MSNIYDLKTKKQIDAPDRLAERVQRITESLLKIDALIRDLKGDSNMNTTETLRHADYVKRFTTEQK